MQSRTRNHGGNAGHGDKSYFVELQSWDGWVSKSTLSRDRGRGDCGRGFDVVRVVGRRVGSLLIVYGIDDSLGFQLVVEEGRIVILGSEGIRSVWGSPLIWMQLDFVEIVEVVAASPVDFLEARCSAAEGHNSVSKVVVLDCLRRAAGCHTVVLEEARSQRSTPRMRGHIRVSAALALGYGWETRCIAARS